MSDASDFPSLAQAACAIKAKRISPVELTNICLARIARGEAQLNAFVTVTEERARAEAREAERAITAGDWRGPLHGIPVGLKDVFETKGVATTANSYQLIDHIPARDSAVAERLSECGAVMVGKLACHEFAFAAPSWDVPRPPARNPWDVARFTGGSSSGTAAAVAAGMILGGIGSDTSGSARSPAALCGIAGLKPTYDAIDRRGVIPLAPSLDHVGPMCWTVKDCAILLHALTRRDGHNLQSAVADGMIALDSNIKGARLGVIRHFFTKDLPISAAGNRAIDVALDVFRDAGCVVRDVQLPPLADWMACGFLILLAEAFALHEHWLKTRPERYGAAFRETMLLGATISGADYLQAVCRRAELVAAMNEVMKDCDVLISAVQPGEASRLDAVRKWALFERPSYALPFNVTGQPALSLCCGFGDAGLPLAIQLAARPWDELTLLRVGHAYETATTWRDCRPATIEAHAS
jgi:Asp-tRNA(Asn)/Glu-tRNA(Gln) amidotransferase A subunit family amidase